MPVPTTPIAAGAALSLVLALGLTSVSTDAAAQTRDGPAPLRTCSGETVTLAWGAVVRDGRGRCRAVARPMPLQRPVARAQVMTETTTACPNRRAYLGGALVICDDQPGARSPQ